MTTTGQTTLITATGTGDSTDKWGSPGVHRLPGRRDAFVISRNDAAPADRDELAGHLGAGELLGTTPPWVPCGLMDMPTLGAFMDAHLCRAGTSVWRMECAPHFDGDPEFDRWRAGEPAGPGKARWLQRLRDDDAAGIEHRRVRIFSSDMSDYERYAVQRGHGPNHAAGERHVVLRAGEHEIPDDLMQCEYWIVNGSIAVLSYYDARGVFVGAGWLDRERSRPFLDDWQRAVTAAEPWDSWWAKHPELHERSHRVA